MSEREPNLEEEVIEAILSAWGEHPQMRLMQLLVNAIHPSTPCPEIFAVEDSQLIKLLTRYKNQSRALDEPPRTKPS